MDCESLGSGESGLDVGPRSFFIISRLHGLATDEGVLRYEFKMGPLRANGRVGAPGETGMTLNPLESAILQAIRATKPEVALALDEQLHAVVVTSRENTGAGFFTTMRPLNAKTLISQTGAIGNIFAKIAGMQNPMTFVLFIKDGIIDALEGASIDESTGGVDFSAVKFEMMKSTFHH